jgi:calcium-dependent protein kinase
VKDILAAVCYMHEDMVMHSDLKPRTSGLLRRQRILASEGDGLCLCSQIQKKGARYDGTQVDTSTYSATQVWKGSYNEKCDIRSVGAKVFVMLCGPFHGDYKKLVDKV